MKYLNLTILLIIVLLGAFLRLHKLREVPAGVYVDEAAIGYNAFTISETGADEYGQVFTVFLRSFSAFSSPLYVYLSAIPISLFGLSAHSVRLLSALSGIANIVVIYLIVNKIFSYKNKYSPFVAALIFAISPWGIFFSRGAFEANLALLILSAAVYLLLFPEKTRYLFTAALLLGVSAYAYQSLRIIPLLLIPAHFLLFRNKNYNFKKAAIVFGIFLVTIIPQIIVVSTPAFRVRAAGLFYSDVVTAQAEKILFLPPGISSFLAFAKEFSAQFTSYFSPANLFLLGDADPQRSIPEMGPFYMWIIVPYLVGLYALTKKLPDRRALFVFALMAAFAAPAALTRDPFSTLRALNLLIPLTIIIGLGTDLIISKRPRLSYATVIFLTAFSLLNLWRGYFVLFASERASIWNYGYDQLAREISDSKEHFVIDNSRIKPPHILLAFFMKIPTVEYQEFAKTKIIKGYYEDTDFDTYYKLRNFETRPIDWETDIYKEQILVGDSLAISEGQVKEHFLDPVFKIYDPLNKLVFQAYRTNPSEKCSSIRNANINCL